MYRENGRGDLGADSDSPWCLANLAQAIVMVAMVIMVYLVGASIDDEVDPNIERMASAERAQLRRPVKAATAHEQAMAEGAGALACVSGGEARP